MNTILRYAPSALGLLALCALLAACPCRSPQGPAAATPEPAPVGPSAGAPAPDEPDAPNAPDPGAGADAGAGPDAGAGDGGGPEPTPPGSADPSAGGPPPDLPEGWTACGSDAECVGVELECCDHCNGGTLVAVHRDHAEAVRQQHGPAQGACQGVACTMRACFGPEPVCEQGRCTLAQGKGPAGRQTP